MTLAFTVTAAVTLGNVARLIRCLIAPERTLTIKAAVKSPVVDNVNRLLKMSLSGCLRIEFASPVIQTEGHIRRLLDLGNKKAGIGCVHCSRCDVDDITLLRLNYIEDLLYSTCLAPVIELLSRHLLAEAHIHLCSRLGIHHIPDLSLAERVISFCRNLIVRMDLHRQPVIDVQELDQKRELASEIVVDILSYYPLKVGLHKFAYGVACEPAVGKHRILYAHIRYLPAFTDERILAYRHLIALFVALDEVLT